MFFPMVNWLKSRFVYTTVSLNWFMCHLQTFQKLNTQHKGMYIKEWKNFFQINIYRN